MSDLNALVEAVVLGNHEGAERLAHGLIDSGVEPFSVIEKALIPAMSIVSDKYDRKEYYLPQMLLSSDAFYAAFSIVKPLLTKDEAGGKGTVVIGVVEGDIHDIGKNLVKTVLEAKGYVCLDMGRDVPVEDYIAKVREVSPDYLMLSTLMTPTMVNMKRVIDGLVEEDTRNAVRVAIGGGPVSIEFAKKIGADNYSNNEKEIVEWLNAQA